MPEPQASNTHYRLGEFAKLAGAKTRTVKFWVERGFLNVEGVGNGPGNGKRHWRMIPAAELPVARIVVDLITGYGCRASDRMFAHARVLTQAPPKSPEARP